MGAICCKSSRLFTILIITIDARVKTVGPTLQVAQSPSYVDFSVKVSISIDAFQQALALHFLYLVVDTPLLRY